MWNFWNNLNIFKWNTTYSHLYEILCEHVYEIGKTQIFKFIFWKDMKIPKDIEKNKKICFSFNILRSHKDIKICKKNYFVKILILNQPLINL